MEGKGPLSSTGIEALLYMKTNNSIDSDPEYPDIEVLQSFATVAFDTCNLLSIVLFVYHYQFNICCTNRIKTISRRKSPKYYRTLNFCMKLVESAETIQRMYLMIITFQSLAQVTRRGINLSPEAYSAVFKPIENRRAFQLLPMLLHPRSKGFLKLKSRNPFHHPLFYPNFLADSRDIDTLVESIRESIRIIEQPEFQKLGAKLYNASVPGCKHTDFNSDEYWRCYVQHLSATLHHQIGTCKMGPASDATAVVDSNGLVHGFSNLRVADVSILPESPSGHTAAIR